MSTIKSTDKEVLMTELKRLESIGLELTKELENAVNKAMTDLENMDSNKKSDNIDVLGIKEFAIHKKSEIAITSTEEAVLTVNDKIFKNLEKIKKVRILYNFMNINEQLKLMSIHYEYPESEELDLNNVVFYITIKEPKARLIAKDVFRIDVEEIILDYGNFTTFPEVPESIYTKYASFGYIELMNLKNSILNFRRERLESDYELFTSKEESMDSYLSQIEKTRLALDEEAELLKTLTKEEYKTFFGQLFMDFSLINFTAN